jgi:23S rRNA (uridine2552-2'-O)-methyltransferase
VSHKRPPDHWNERAKKDGYSARSAYKLEEIQRRFRVIRKQPVVLDLGCAPGSWTQYLGRVTGYRGTVVGVDIQDVPGYPGTLLQDSVFDVDPARILELLGGPADLVMSDMAPNTTGNRFTDHVRQIELAEAARSIAAAVLRPGGNFVVKVFDGEDAPEFVLRMRRDYDKARRVRPEATRGKSVEFFMVGLGRKAPAPE